jgi:hypothetical protein
MKRFFLFAISFVLIIYTAAGQNLEKKRYKAEQIIVAPVVNGILDEEIWQGGNWIDDFTQHEPYNGAKASQKTEFKIVFDKDNIYVGIKAFDTSPDSIVSRLTRRDHEEGDMVGVIFDSYHDLRTGFLFGVTSSGVKWDQIFSNDGQNEDESWDPNWWAKTSINSTGWIAEMKIPFSQLRFENNSGDVWGFEVVRTLYRKQETSLWQHIPKDAPGIVHLFGEVAGFENIKPRKIFDVTPYAVARTESFKAEPENPFLAKGKKSGFNGGIDAKIGVTNNLTVDLTVNPDFGQVEADPSEVNLSAYETFFQEKRPFFIEGNNITNFGLGIGDGGVGNDNLFYSRRIGRRPQIEPDLKDGWNADMPTNTNIIGAAKLTGKTKDGLSVGFVEALTAEEMAEIDTVGGRKFETVEPLTNYFVGRVQKDYKEGNTIIGGIFTGTNRDLDKNLDDYLHRAAYTGGLDFTQYFKKKNWMFNLNSAFSLVQGTKDAILRTQTSSARYFQRPDNFHTRLDSTRTSLAGSGGRMQVMKLNGHWNVMLASIWKTPGFETNDLGFIRDADQLLNVLWIGYNQWEPKGFYRRYSIGGDIYNSTNFGGLNQGIGFEYNGNIGFKNYWNAWGGGGIQTAAYETGQLRGGPAMKMPGTIRFNAGFETDERKKVVFDVFGNFNSGFNNSSQNFYSQIEVKYKPLNYLTISLQPGVSKSNSDLQYVTQTSFGNSDRYVFAAIDRKTINASFRINLNLSPDLTLQYWGQPFIATGKYSDYKYITDPRAGSYESRFIMLEDDNFRDGENNYNVDEDKNGSVDYGFDNADFNFKEFLSNLVVRWEYNPGSSVYLVWSQTRQHSADIGDLNVLEDMGDLFDSKSDKPHNVFLIKFSYRFGIK